jgi:hypothetical protein
MSTRGVEINDTREFNAENTDKLRKATEEIKYLINRGHILKSASTYVGNHYMLSERQRLAIVRSVSTDEDIKIRKEKELTDIENKTVYIDGFNTVITLEVALSGGTLLHCADGCIRDLAGIRGTYRLIDKTDIALDLICKTLEKEGISKAVFYYDSLVSNSGRLKTRTAEIAEKYNFDLDIQVIKEVDSTLSKLGNVITADAIILNNCKSWFNLMHKIVDESYNIISVI